MAKEGEGEIWGAGLRLDCRPEVSEANFTSTVQISTCCLAKEVDPTCKCRPRRTLMTFLNVLSLAALLYLLTAGVFDLDSPSACLQAGRARRSPSVAVFWSICCSLLAPGLHCSHCMSIFEKLADIMLPLSKLQQVGVNRFCMISNCLKMCPLNECTTVP